MSTKHAIRIAVLAASVSASAALAQQYWAPPADIAPKNPVAAPPPAAPAAAPAATAPAPVAAAADKPAPSGDKKMAKAKDCAAQADAKALRGAERKKFQEQCKKS